MRRKRKAGPGPNMNGRVVWRGVSQLDHKTPVVMIMVGLKKGSTNIKTGAMVQTYILRADLNPIDAVATRRDGAICGACKHRKQTNGVRTCYVNLGKGANGVWKCFERGGYPVATLPEAAEAVRGKFVRFGTYGDPAAVPVHVWAALASTAGGYTGYTHQWRAARFAPIAAYCQASCETAADVDHAHRMGFQGTFHVLPVGGDVPTAALHCPASAERGKVATCVACRACDGSRDVVIHAHGPSKRRYLPLLAV
jgi:hypothetical protein